MSSIQLAWLDLKRLTRSRFARVALVGVCLMPLFYSFLYLYSSWDPYGKLSHMPVALVNEDQGVTLNGQPANFGQQLVDKLKNNHDVQWEPVSRQVAEEGLQSGRYYLVLFVPADLTQTVLTATDEHPRKAEIVYESNQSTNYLASSIGGKLMAEVRTQFANEISGQFFTNILVSMRDGSAGLQTAADGARQLADGAAQATQGSKDLQNGVAQLYDGAKQVSTGAAAAHAGAQDLAQGIAQAGTKVAAAGQGASQLSAGLGASAKGGAQLAAGLDQLHAGTDQFAGGVNQLADGLLQFKAGLTDQQKGLPMLVGGATKVQTGLNALNQGMAPGLTQLQSGVGDVTTGLTGAEALLQQYAAANPAAQADPTFQRALATVGAARSGLTDKVTPGLAQVSAQAGTGLKQLADGQAQVVGGLTQLQATAGTALTQVTDGAVALKANMAGLQKGVDQARAGATQLNAGLAQLGAGAQDLQKGLTDPSGMNQLKAGSQALLAGLSQLQDGSQRLTTGMGDLQVGVGKLGDGITQVRDGNATLATKLNDAATQMADQAKGDANERGKALASPVELKDHPVTRVPNYGTGLAPYFLPVSLWVGAMVLFFVVGLKENRVKASLTSVPAVVMSKFFTLAVLGVLQAVIASFAVHTFLGLQPQSLWQFYAFNILLSWTFIAIQQLLVSVAGLVGRFAAIVLLTLQLASSAGTFPVELLPHFMQVIHPYLPMTYAVAGLRRVIGGSATYSMTRCLTVLVAFLVGGLLLTMLTASRYVLVSDLHPAPELAS